MTRPDGGKDEDAGRDFASAAMMRLVAAGLARQGLPVAFQPPTQARAPRAQKRDVLGEILTAHGPLAILSIADAAPDMPSEPVVEALIRARDIDDLLDRWGRLERFSHGRHTVETRRLDDGCFRLTHRARDDGPPPSPAESLLVIGLIARLAEMIGAPDLRLTSGAGEVLRENGAWRAPRGVVAIANFVLSARPGEGSSRGVAAIPHNDPVASLRERLCADPVRRWTLSRLAAEAGMSPRTLQRRLAQKSISFSRLLFDARLQIAAARLCEGRGPALAEIGFLAGFADQAHFTRSFSRFVGTTPKAYRADFGR